MSAPNPPRHLLAGRYHIDRELGHGGMADVFLARDALYQRPVAIKLIREELTVTAGATRFMAEIRAAARLQHPNIVPILDSGEVDGRPFYVMPYLAEGTLRDRLAREGRLDVPAALRMAREVAEALQYAHSEGFVHRDVKPGNIFLADTHAMLGDFGIVRALEESTGERVTWTGMAVGTPQYMSPEQALGSDDLDGRSDVYSLGCVLFEALTGEPPFGGSAPRAVVAQHLRAPIPSVREARGEVPASVQGAISRALSKDPADRHATARDFGAALESSSTSLLASSGWRDRLSRAARMRVGVAALVVVLGGLTWMVGRGAGGVDLIETRHVLVPLPMADSALGHRAAAVRYQLQDVFSRVPGIGLEGSLRVEDRLARLGTRPSFEDAIRLAGDLRAGGLLLVRAASLGDSVVLELQRYRTDTRQAVARATLTLDPGVLDLGSRLATAAERLFDLPRGSVTAHGDPIDPEARLAYAEARETLERSWDFETAEEKLVRALSLEPEYADAHFQLAEIRAWQGRPVSGWAVHARSATRRSESLSMPTGSSLASALVHLASGRDQAACGVYEELVSADSTSFRAWFGLGMCNEDQVVVPDPASPTGYSFRASYNAAIDAYERALELIPSFNRSFQGQAYHRLSYLLFTSPHRHRRGISADSSLEFLARPVLVGDSTAFYPVPWERRGEAASWFTPERHYAALDRSRQTVSRIVTRWASAFPESAEAHEARALALESLGQLRGRPSALEAIRRARSLGFPSEVSTLEAAITELRLHLRLLDFERSRQIADSLLAAVDVDSPEEAVRLAGVAALTGRVFRAAELQRIAAPHVSRQSSAARFGTTDPAVWEAAEALLAYAAFGEPRDSVRVWEARLSQLVRSQVAPEPEAARPILSAFLERPAAWIHAHHGVTTKAHGRESRSYILQLQRLISQARLSEARSLILRIERARVGRRTGEVPLAQIYQEARAFLALGDTTGARESLEAALGALARVPFDLPSPVEAAVALVRTMALRGELALVSGEISAARRWAAGSETLWRGADPPIRSILAPLVGSLESE